MLKYLLTRLTVIVFAAFFYNAAGNHLKAASIILDHPQSITKCEGYTGEIRYEISTILGQYTYQWEYKPQDFQTWLEVPDSSGGNTSSITLNFKKNSPLSSSHDKTLFRCVVSSRFSSETSKEAALYVSAAPNITLQANSLIRFVGEPASFTIRALGSTPLFYQWVKDSVPIKDAVSSTYSIPFVNYQDSGTYWCHVTNSCGSVTSEKYTLDVESVCDPGKMIVSVIIRTDLNGDENSWTLKSFDSEEVYASGGPYSSGEIVYDQQEICVPEGELILFEFHDAGANGIGEGYFSLMSDGNIIAEHTGYMASYKRALFEATPVSSCNANEVNLVTRVHKPSSIDEIHWEIMDKEDGTLYAGSGELEHAIDYFFTRTCVPEGREVEFTITNERGGGIYNGHYEVGFSCVTVSTGGQDFDIRKSVSFSLPEISVRDNVFEKKIGGDNTDRAHDLQSLCEGGYIMAGMTGPLNIDPGYQAYLLKTDLRGDTLWAKTYGGNGTESANSVCQNRDGGFVLAGYTNSDISSTDMYLVKTDYLGDELWSKNLGGTGVDIASKVITLPEGGYIVCGYTSSYGAGSYDAYILKVNEEGSEEWDYTYGSTLSDGATTATLTSDGKIVIAGYENAVPGPFTGNNIFLMKMDPDQGDTLWVKHYLEGSQSDRVSHVIETEDEGFMLVGFNKITGNPDNYSDILVIKTDHKGNIVNRKTFDFGKNDYGKSIQAAYDGGYIVAGSSGDDYAPEGSEDHPRVLLLKLSTSQNNSWSRLLGNPLYKNSGNAMVIAPDGGYVIAGETYYDTYPVNRPDLYFLKTDGAGCLVAKPVVEGSNVFCEGDSLMLTSKKPDILSDYIIDWSNGSEKDTIHVDSSGTHNVTLIDPFGCVRVSEDFEVEEIPLPDVTVVYDSTTLHCIGETVELTALVSNQNPENNYSFTWNTRDSTQTIEIEEGGKHAVYVENLDYGCADTSAIVDVIIQKPYQGDDICMVTVDEETGKNMIIFNKTPDEGTVSHIIWKESQFAYLYEAVGAVPFEGPNYFIDTASTPSQQASRYKISVVDICGNQSFKSLKHKTMHLTVNAGGDAQGGNNLIWDHYEGFLFGTYTIYRGSDPTSLDSIHSIQSTLTSWTDSDPPTGDLFYQISVRKLFPCMVHEGLKKARSGPRSSSVSNLEDNRQHITRSLMLMSNEANFNVYPNPYLHRTRVQYTLEQASPIVLSIYSVTGSKIRDLIIDDLDAGTYEIELNADDLGLKQGIYYLKLKAGDFTATRKIVQTGN